MILWAAKNCWSSIAYFFFLAKTENSWNEFKKRKFKLKKKRIFQAMRKFLGFGMRCCQFHDENRKLMKWKLFQEKKFKLWEMNRNFWKILFDDKCCQFYGKYSRNYVGWKFEMKMPIGGPADFIKSIVSPQTETIPEEKHSMLKYQKKFSMRCYQLLKIFRFSGWKRKVWIFWGRVRPNYCINLKSIS